MDTLATQRVISLVDMDCFYCQVEARLDPSLKGKPMAVVQYNQWKQGGIVAVSYEARAQGVTRMMRGEEAVKKCPELQLRSIPCVRGKADLTKFRDAGAEVAAVFCEFSDCVQRASIDEAFIDLTAVVEDRIKKGSFDLAANNLPSTYAVGYCDLKDNNSEERAKGIKKWVQKLAESRNTCCPELKLAVGCLVVEEMRAQVLKKTGFTCSAGIAHNKILAKLVAGLHKPKCQTVLPHDSVPELYENLPLHKVRGLGGKYGKIVGQKLGITTMAELYNISREQLQDKFADKSGWLYDIARGIDHDPVVARLMPESIGCCKNFRGKNALTTPANVQHWLAEMAEEVSDRLGKDFAENRRRAKLLTVSFKQNSAMSRSCVLSSYQAAGIAADAFHLLQKFNVSSSSDTWEPPITFLGLSVSKFSSGQSETTNIKSFFAAPASQLDMFQDEMSSAEEIKTPVESDRKENSVIETKETHDIQMNKDLNSSVIASNRGIKRYFEKCTPKNKDSCDIPVKKIIEKETRRLTAQDAKTDDCDRNVEDSGENKSFFARFIGRKININDSTLDLPSSLPDTSTSIAPDQCSASLNLEPSSSEECQEEALSVKCPDCQEQIHLSVYLEHIDYHAALKLDNDLNGKMGQVTKKRKVGPSKITTYFESLPKISK